MVAARLTSAAGAVDIPGQIKGRLRRVSLLKELLQILSVARALRGTGNFRFLFPYVPGHYPGHYYSVLPDYREVLAGLAKQSKTGHELLPGIDLAEEEQLKLLRAFAGYYSELPFPARPDGRSRYYYENDWFSLADATILYSVLRYHQPQRVVEIGSGFSSAAMLDVNDLFLEGASFTFVEPNPERLYGLLTGEDRARHQVVRERVQEVHLALFDELNEGDVLFVDSSHVVKFGSDVAHLLFEVLPRLKPGVLVHFHDVFWPFEYPEEWYAQGRAWNEAYFLRAFLQHNCAFRIHYYASFMAYRHPDMLNTNMPLASNTNNPLAASRPSSLWLRKT